MPAPLDPSRPVRWGFLGAGRIAEQVGHAVVASPDHELVAIGSRSAERAGELAATLGAEARCYGSYDELVNDPDVDVIYVATPHSHHHEHALLALSAGKPVLVEKAFTLTGREAREVIAAARARDLFCMEAMWMRTNPLVTQAQKLIADGGIGDVLSVHADHGQRFPFDPNGRLFAMELGGGALLDLGVYSATAAWLFLGRPDAVSAVGELSSTGSDLTTAMQWSYTDGRYAHVSSTTRSLSPTTATVVGTGGWLRLERPFYNPPRMVVNTTDGDERTIERGDNPYPYGHEVDEVARCLRAGALESELMTWADTVAIMDLMDDARRQVGVRYAADDTADGSAPASV
jgi:predicted dehydrogenase